MNSRVKEIRKNAGLSQSDFGIQIGVSRDAIANIECGRVEMKDLIVKSICREFNVNEEWLRTGTGEPYVKLETNDIVAKAAAMLGRHDPLFEAIIEVYSRLDDVDKAVLMRTAEDLVNTYNAKKKE